MRIWQTQNTGEIPLFSGIAQKTMQVWNWIILKERPYKSLINYIEDTDQNILLTSLNARNWSSL